MTGECSFIQNVAPSTLVCGKCSTTKKRTPASAYSRGILRTSAAFGRNNLSCWRAVRNFSTEYFSALIVVFAKCLARFSQAANAGDVAEYETSATTVLRAA